MTQGTTQGENMNNFSQEDFNEKHREAHEYGESEYIIVADDYTEDEAVKKITELIDLMLGDDESRYDYYDIPNVGKIGVGIGKNEDGEPDYVINSDKTPYQAWCVEQIS